MFHFNEMLNVSSIGMECAFYSEVINPEIHSSN